MKRIASRRISSTSLAALALGASIGSAQERFGLGPRGEIYRQPRQEVATPTLEASLRLVESSISSLALLGEPVVDERCRSLSVKDGAGAGTLARLSVTCADGSASVFVRIADEPRTTLMRALGAIEASASMRDLGVQAALAPFADAVWIGSARALPLDVVLGGIDGAEVVAALDARGAYRVARVVEDVALAASFLPAAADDPRARFDARERATIEHDLGVARTILTECLRAPDRPSSAIARARLHLRAAAETMTAGDALGPQCSSGEPEFEANSTKYEATSVSCLVAGTFVTGLTTGSVVAPGFAGTESADYFRIQVCPSLPGIYERRLTITTSGTPGHTGTIRGLSQTGGVIVAGTDDITQSSSTTTSPPRFNQWYGFGKGEEFYYRVTGTPATTAPYELRLSSTPIVPAPIPMPARAGAITISTVAMGHSTDTEITVFDHLFDPLPGFHNDDEGPGGTTLQSRLTRTFAEGTYYVAIGTYNTCTDQSDANADEDYQNGLVLDLPGAIVNSSIGTNNPVDFSVFDGTTLQTIAATTTQPYQVLFFELVVGSSGSSYCFGDGTGTACPCGNSGTSGNGCANSLNPNGANLSASGNASLTSDSLVLSCVGMPNSSCLYYQGTTRSGGGNGVVFGDGLRCAGGSVLRLGTKMNSAGASSYPGGGDASISVRGAVTITGSVRTYQAWYRNTASFCTAALFNLANGVEIVWGA